VSYVVLEGPTARIGGRCAYESVKVGDVFTEAASTIPATEEADYALEPSIKNRRAVAVHIDAITAYQHSFQELDRGMTAELVVRGEGLSRIVAHDILTNGES
jgi:hypothetical protein